MDIDNVDSCNICMNLYDSGVRPRCLPCGHYYCTSCITDSIRDRRLTCPHCQKSHPASSANDFPIIYGIEALISEFRKAKLGAIPKVQSESSFRQSQPVSKWTAVFNDEKESLRKLIEVCEEILSEMPKYQTFLDHRATEHEEFIPKIKEWLKCNEDVLKEITAEKKRLSDAVKEANELKKKAACTLSRFDSVSDTKDIITGSEEVGKSYEVLEKWRIRSQNQLPNAKLIRSSEKIVRETTSALCLLNAEDDDVEEFTEEDFTTLPTMSKVEMLRGESKISVGDLRDMSPHKRNKLERGIVYAVENKAGQIRSARVSLRNNNIYLHHLQDVKPPINAVTIQHDELMKTVKTDSVIAFMDLSWEGSVRGRIHILLSPDTPLARHFRILCSGELGPSYANSRFLGVQAKGGQGEHVYGGDYDRGDGTGGASLLTGLNPSDVIYDRRWDEGIVWARFAENGPGIAQFAITSRRMPGSVFCRVFGLVIDGLEIVKAAVNLDDIKKVKVEDCGLVVEVISSCSERK